LAGKLYLTLVHQDFEADTFFPEIDYSEWEQLNREDHHDEKNNFNYAEKESPVLNSVLNRFLQNFK
jgi:dihydrofolate reductase